MSARDGYHHGDLRQAMIAAAEAVLAERGIGGLTLRECARRAGVSPAAPAHHFGNLGGLLTVIATLGFDDLSDAMEAAAEAAGVGDGRLAAIARAYLATALAKPGRFRVVFGRRGLDWDAPEFKRAASRAFGILVRETRSHVSGVAQEAQEAQAAQGEAAEPPGVAGSAELGPILFVWSVTHGFSTLLIDGQLDFVAGEAGRDGLVALYSQRLVALLVSALAPPAGLTKAHGDG